MVNIKLAHSIQLVPGTNQRSSSCDDAVPPASALPHAQSSCSLFTLTHSLTHSLSLPLSPYPFVCEVTVGLCFLQLSALPGSVSHKDALSRCLVISRCHLLCLSLLRRWLCFSQAAKKHSCGSPRESFPECSLLLYEICQSSRCSGRFSIVEYSEQRPQLYFLR